MEFKTFTCLDGSEKIYCADPSYVVFFNVEDERYFLYSLCTNDDLNSCSLGELSFDNYTKIKNLDSKYCEIKLESFEALVNTVVGARLQTEQSFVTLGEILKL